MRDEQLLDYLKGSCSGRKNRVGGTELERTLHVSGTDLRKLVNQLRRKTHPIASDRNGYFYATTAGEVYDTIRQLKRMAAGLEAAINGLERSMDRFREDEEAGHGYAALSLDRQQGEDRTVHPAAFPAQADAVCGTIRRQRRSAAGSAAGPKPIGHL